MSQRSDKVYLRNIVDTVVTIQGYIVGMDH